MDAPYYNGAEDMREFGDPIQDDVTCPECQGDGTIWVTATGTSDNAAQIQCPICEGAKVVSPDEAGRRVTTAELAAAFDALSARCQRALNKMGTRSPEVDGAIAFTRNYAAQVRKGYR